MNRWLRKKYRLFSGLFLAVVFVGWTAFINNSDTKPSEASSKSETVTPTPVILADADGKSSDVPSGDTAVKTVPEPLEEIDSATGNPSDSETLDEQPDDLPDEPVVEPTADVTPEPTPVPVVTEAPTPEITTEPTPEPTAEPVKELAITFPYAVANISTKMNVRSGPGEDSAIIAKMSSNAYCEVIEWGAEWTKIKSGTITGYAYTEYLLFNDEAIERLQRLNKLLIKVTSNTLNIRSMPNTDCTVLGKAYNGHKYMYLPNKSVEGWYCIQYSETEVGYMSAEFCTIFIDADTAVPIS